MSTTTNVQQVKLNIMTQSQYNSITPTATELYVVTDANPITSTDIADALGYIPYSNANPSGYQANVIETILVNGTTIVPTGKTVDITVGSSGTVGNGDMVIQRNGTAIGTFTANQTDASTVNIALTQVVWRTYS